MKKLLYVIAFALTLGACMPIQQYRGIRVADLTEDGAAGTFEEAYDRSILVAVGIDRYRNVDVLRHAVGDAKAMVRLFKSQGFEAHELYDDDATREAILARLQSAVFDAGPNDRVVFFFAGHGTDMRDRDGNVKGYLIPVEGKLKDAESLVPMDWLQIDLLADERTQAKHVLFVLDACSSGIVAARSTINVDRSVRNYISELIRRRARQVITAGTGEQQVLDGGYKGHSIFAGLVLQGLEGNQADINKDYHITATELGLFLSQQVYISSRGAQKPDFAKLMGTRGGEVILKFPTKEERSILEKRATEDLAGQAELVLDLPATPVDIRVQDMAGKTVIAKKNVSAYVRLSGLEAGDYQVLILPREKKYLPVKLIVGLYGTVTRKVDLPRNVRRDMAIPFL